MIRHVGTVVGEFVEGGIGGMKERQEAKVEKVEK